MWVTSCTAALHWDTIWCPAQFRGLKQRFFILLQISDFGMSRDLTGSGYYMTKGGRVPVKWTAPEAILYCKYSTNSDIWSYGMVMYEIWSIGWKPFDSFSIDQVSKHVGILNTTT